MASPLRIHDARLSSVTPTRTLDKTFPTASLSPTASSAAPGLCRTFPATSGPALASDDLIAREKRQEESVSAPVVSFLEKDPKPEGHPRCWDSHVRVLVAASGYIDFKSSSRLARAKTVAGKLARATGTEKVDTNYISCTDSFVQLNTTYTDSKRFMFHKVYGSTNPTDIMFQDIVPMILDTTNGINGSVVVRTAAQLSCITLITSVVSMCALPCRCTGKRARASLTWCVEA